ncbi:TonB-dependent receptor [Niabella ginsenosidivorans]|uniref:TonB-dependent receptor n=1 Tax=Niabella ginsenosidivorans TaxID=1176587 RepID=A0A1A9HX98_9BACT|nr:TonB-dependent receptor [Niabella ginsenosidivorans]ANH79863.1 TonB-dependent receptor [Niabella ginsenosidivorans]
MLRIYILCVALLATAAAYGQQLLKGTVFDADTKEPLADATIHAGGHSFRSDAKGVFYLPAGGAELDVSCAGYVSRHLPAGQLSIGLKKRVDDMEEVIVSGNRTAQKRREAPVAITSISKQVMDDTRPQRMDQLLNKVSGVFMVSLGNEQHEMSIRQPMTTKSLFLYMEDGVPIRTTGVYNHNALLEMNLTAARSVEVIRGPSSALYGAEAIGGAVNVITQAAPAFTNGTISLQINNAGYKRADLQAGTSVGKWGFLLSGYYADKTNGPVEFSDFHKTALTLRSDYRPNEQTSWTNTISLVDYYSDMTGALDSIRFARKDYSSLQTFTYRKVTALRYKSMLTQNWNANSSTNVSLLYRNNATGQNPSYAISSTSDPQKFKGQINDNSFRTYALFATHSQKFKWLQSRIVAGGSIDFSPQGYYAKFISVNKDPVTGKYASYTAPATDSFLSNYHTGILNMAGYLDYELNPFDRLKLVLALRYDAFKYYFINDLPASTSVSTASTVNSFARVTPKLGFTYNFKGVGFYANYSQGYVPPQLTDLYSSVKEAPYLLPQTFFNYEAGGWASLLRSKLYLDWSLYRLDGANEIISVRQTDNSYINENAGSTRHTGIEYGITYRPCADLSIRFSGTNAKHTFIKNLVRGVDYSGKEMSGAPRFTGNAEVSYKPAFVKGLRASIEWQHQGRYFMDDLDKERYEGFDVINCRAGYQLKNFEVWVNVLNATNRYYAVYASKNATSGGNAAYSYNLGDPREITLGVAYHFGHQ